MHVRVIGGLFIQYDSEGDNKIIAVLNDDVMFKNVRDANELPVELIYRLKRTFII